MRFTKQALSAVLLTAMLASLAACGGDAPSADTTTAPAAADTTLSPEQARLAIDDGLPERDFNGYEFVIWSLSPQNYAIEEETGDIVDDAKYARQLTLSERFNVSFATNEKGWVWQDLNTNIRTSVLAADGAFDLAMPHQIGSGPSLIIDQLIIPWDDVPYINMEQPWWNQRINETINIMDHQFYICGQISLPSPFSMFYNKQYIEDYDLEDMYDLVTEGRWTVDKLLEMTKTVSKDLNGDSQMKPTDDQYGISFNVDNQTLNFMYAANHMSVIVNKDGEPEPNVVNDKMITLIEKINKLTWEDNRTLSTTYSNQGELGSGGFRDGRVFIKCGSVNDAASMRDFEIDFGLIPYPKYDEAQEGYYTHVDASNGMLCIPAYADDLERTGIITEAFAAETYKQVMPVYYDKALGAKYMRDDKSVEMMDIIFNGIVYDFGYIFDSWKNCTWTIVRLVAKNSSDVASHWASIKDSVEAHYDALYEGVLAYDE